jgi:hypothetical protein
MVKKIKVLVVATVATAAMALPAVASASPADGGCVSEGVSRLRGAIGTVAPSGPGVVAGVIQDHLRNPGNYSYC